jgi:hypothetical protein
MADVTVIYQHCKYLREMLNDCKTKYKELFGTFPNAYCADTSLWLCDYLINKGFDSFLFRFRSKDPFIDEGGNHVWLNYLGIDIDITADQFNDVGYVFPQIIVSTNDIHYLSYDEEWCKKEYSLHNYSPLCCMYEHWDERYEIVYKMMGMIFDPNSITIAI